MMFNAKLEDYFIKNLMPGPFTLHRLVLASPMGFHITEVPLYSIQTSTGPMGLYN